MPRSCWIPLCRDPRSWPAAAAGSADFLAGCRGTRCTAIRMARAPVRADVALGLLYPTAFSVAAATDDAPAGVSSACRGRCRALPAAARGRSSRGQALRAGLLDEGRSPQAPSVADEVSRLPLAPTPRRSTSARPLLAALPAANRHERHRLPRHGDRPGSLSPGCRRGLSTLSPTSRCRSRLAVCPGLPPSGPKLGRIQLLPATSVAGHCRRSTWTLGRRRDRRRRAGRGGRCSSPGSARRRVEPAALVRSSAGPSTGFLS